MKSFVEFYNQIKPESYQPERRFRASIYVDIFVPETNDLEVDRKTAEQQVKEMAEKIPNSYVGGVAAVSGNLMKPLDRDI